MTTPLPKLVRDRIPELIAASGRDATTTTLPEAERASALLAKLREETAELAAAPAEQRVEELADVLEVVQALAAALGIAWADVLETAVAKRQDRGGFADGVMLVDVAPEV